MYKKEEKGHNVALLFSLALILMFIIQKAGGLTGNAIGEVVLGVSNQYLIIILSLTGIIIILAIILVIVLNKKKHAEEEYTEKRVEYRKKEVDELEEEAKKIVWQARAKGYTDPEIKVLFRNKGWDEEDIDSILKE
ncbi:MAG: hypothetical protein QXO70_01145 [Candidatus Pacearchaeota archaeon]